VRKERKQRFGLSFSTLSLKLYANKHTRVGLHKLLYDLRTALGHASPRIHLPLYITYVLEHRINSDSQTKV
jgi:hypothetical protein